MWLLLIVFYWGLYCSKVPTAPLNYLSLIHASSSVVLYYWFDWQYIMLCNSVTYFLVDTWITWGTFWVAHHGLAIFGLLPAILYPDLRPLATSVLGLAEMGGLLYHMSRMFPKSKQWREVFLLTYGGSRLYGTIVLFIGIWELLYKVYYSWQHWFGAMTLALTLGTLAPFNWWFFAKQVNLYKQNFL